MIMDLELQQVSRWGSTIETPLPTPVGANTAVCTALDSLTMSWWGLPRIERMNVSHGARAESFRLYRAGSETPEEIKLPAGDPLYACEADEVAAALARGELESPAMSHADTLGNMAMLDAWRAAIGVKYDGE